MKAIPSLGVQALRVGLVACLVAILTACVADEGAEQRSAPETVTASVQPRHAIYDCGAEGRISVENSRAAVRLVEASGTVFDLPAAPPSQTSRYGMGGLALVLEEREALWMKAGHEPVTCRR